MKTKREIKAWLLENCVDNNGNLNLAYLDFKDFDGDVFIFGMKVKNNLLQSDQIVGGNIEQDFQMAGGNLYQGGQAVEGKLCDGGADYEFSMGGETI